MHNITLLNKRKTLLSLARCRCRFNLSLSSSSRAAAFEHDDRLSSVALLSLVPYFFARYIFGGLEIPPVAFELRLTMPSPFLLNNLSQPTYINFEIYAQLRNTYNLHYHYAFMELLELSSFDSSKCLDLSLLSSSPIQPTSTGRRHKARRIRQ